MPWRETVTAVSSNIFPDLAITDTSFDLGTYAVITNVPLQMFLFFNVVIFPFWFMSSCVFLYLKFECLGHLTRFLAVGVLTMTSSIECMRLYLGYVGNLTEGIPELAGFWMLSVLLQLPLQSFQLGNPWLQSRPTELVLHSSMWLLLAGELVTGCIALRAAAARAKKHCSLRAHLRARLATVDDKSKED